MDKFIKCPRTNDVLFTKVSVEGYDSQTIVVVPDTHNAIIIKDGIALETLGSGKYYIFNKKKKEFIKELAGADFVEVVFVSKTLKLNINWGTTTQFDMRDPICNIPIKLGASGEYEVQICNPRKAYLELIGVDDRFDAEKLKNRLLGRLLSEVQYLIANVMQEKKLSYDRMGEVLLPISQEIFPHLKEMFEREYGLKMYSFTILRVIVNKEEQERINTAHSIRADSMEKERLEEKMYQRQLDLTQLAREDYEKYLEVCKIVGWPQKKKEDKKEKEPEEIKTCLNCGAELTPAAKFCKICGLPTDKKKRKCPSCKKSIGADEIYCHLCGTRVIDVKENKTEEDGE